MYVHGDAGGSVEAGLVDTGVLAFTPRTNEPRGALTDELVQGHRRFADALVQAGLGGAGRRHRLTRLPRVSGQADALVGPVPCVEARSAVEAGRFRTGIRWCFAVHSAEPRAALAGHVTVLVDEAGTAVETGGNVAAGGRLELADGAAMEAVAEAHVVGAGVVVDALAAVQAGFCGTGVGDEFAAITRVGRLAATSESRRQETALGLLGF